MNDVITITGLQTGAPNDWTPKRCDRPFPVEVELDSRLDQPASRELVLTVETWSGARVYRARGPVQLAPGRNVAVTSVPPHVLLPGRHALVLELEGEDRFRSRHPIDAWLPSGSARREPAPADAEGWDLCAGPMSRHRAFRHVEQVRFQRPDGSEPPWFFGDEPVRLVTQLNIDGLPPDPMVRITLFTLDGELAVGTNSERTGITLGHGGHRTVVVDFERLNLAPGRYLATVGLWPEETAPEPFEARHGFHELIVEHRPG